MPTPRNDDHRLRLGTYTGTDITSTYAIKSWANQTDQIVDNQVDVPWAGPVKCLPPQRARITIAADGTASEDGWLKGILGPFSYWTMDMNGYFLTTIFPAGVRFSLVSMMLFDEKDDAVYVNATMYRPVAGQDYKAVYGGWESINLRYDVGEFTS